MPCVPCLYRPVSITVGRVRVTTDVYGSISIWRPSWALWGGASSPTLPSRSPSGETWRVCQPVNDCSTVSVFLIPLEESRHAHFRPPSVGGSEVYAILTWSSNVRTVHRGELKNGWYNAWREIGFALQKYPIRYCGCREIRSWRLIYWSKSRLRRRDTCPCEAVSIDSLVIHSELHQNSA